MGLSNAANQKFFNSGYGYHWQPRHSTSYVSSEFGAGSYQSPAPPPKHTPHGDKPCKCGYKPKRKDRVMATQALWCETGDHAFSEKDKGKRSYSEQIQIGEDENGEAKYRTEHFTVCGPCSAAHKPFQKRDDNPPAAPAIVAGEPIPADYPRPWREDIK